MGFLGSGPATEWAQSGGDLCWAAQLMEGLGSDGRGCCCPHPHPHLCTGLILPFLHPLPHSAQSALTQIVLTRELCCSSTGLSIVPHRGSAPTGAGAALPQCCRSLAARCCNHALRRVYNPQSWQYTHTTGDGTLRMGLLRHMKNLTTIFVFHFLKMKQGLLLKAHILEHIHRKREQGILDFSQMKPWCVAKYGSNRSCNFSNTEKLYWFFFLPPTGRMHWLGIVSREKYSNIAFFFSSFLCKYCIELAGIKWTFQRTDVKEAYCCTTAIKEEFRDQCVN